MDFLQCKKGDGVFLRRFKYEIKWLLDSEHDAILDEVWQEDSSGAYNIQVVQNKLATCQRSLSRWSCRRFGDTERIIKEKTKALADLQHMRVKTSGRRLKS